LQFKQYFPYSQPNRLLSPETTLKRRKANCFEFSTLLCSFLIGTGFAACVVSGYAKREICMNDLSHVECPTQPKSDDGKIVDAVRSPKKYDLKDPPDLRSKYEINLEQKRADKILQSKLKVEAEELAKIQVNIFLPAFSFWFPYSS
jgi:hypothetical protein